jgi:hypothetical protein
LRGRRVADVNPARPDQCQGREFNIISGREQVERRYRFLDLNAVARVGAIED